MIFALVYSFYAVSGGNINPAVSLGLVLSGRMTLPRGIGYIAAQIVGAITGVAMAKAVSPAAFNLAKGGINALQVRRRALPRVDERSQLTTRIGSSTCLPCLCSHSRFARPHNPPQKIHTDARDRDGRRDLDRRHRWP